MDGTVPQPSDGKLKISPPGSISLVGQTAFPRPPAPAIPANPASTQRSEGGTKKTKGPKIMSPVQSHFVQSTTRDPAEELTESQLPLKVDMLAIGVSVTVIVVASIIAIVLFYKCGPSSIKVCESKSATPVVEVSPRIVTRNIKVSKVHPEGIVQNPASHKVPPKDSPLRFLGMDESLPEVAAKELP